MFARAHETDFRGICQSLGRVARENVYRRMLLDYSGRTRISRRYMRTLTQTNDCARGDSHECESVFLIRMMLSIARAHAALRPVRLLMKITPASFELRAELGNNKF